MSCPGVGAEPARASEVDVVFEMAALVSSIFPVIIASRLRELSLWLEVSVMGLGLREELVAGPYMGSAPFRC